MKPESVIFGKLTETIITKLLLTRPLDEECVSKNNSLMFQLKHVVGTQKRVSMRKF